MDLVKIFLFDLSVTLKFYQQTDRVLKNKPNKNQRNILKFLENNNKNHCVLYFIYRHPDCLNSC